MLTPRRNPSGFTLVELMITLTIAAVLLLLGLPSFFAWLQSSQIRNSADSILNALALARTEAIRRNTPVNFQLVTTVTASCTVSTSGTSWVVSLESPAGKCNQPQSDSVAPRIVQKRAVNEGSPNVVVAADLATITFNGMGQATNLVVSPTSITVTNPTGGACASAGGPIRCLRVDTTPGGQIRMCDPARASTDPQGC
jgi:type IV fimbrial biogenesis protein FimT